jgi:hypothetical protein
MLKRLICRAKGHITGIIPYENKEVNGKMTVVIPIDAECLRCKKMFFRPLELYEMMAIINGQAITCPITRRKTK